MHLDVGVAYPISDSTNARFVSADTKTKSSVISQKHERLQLLFVHTTVMRHISRAHFVVWAVAILSISSAEKSFAKEHSGHVHIDQIIAIEKAYYPREGGYCDNTPPESPQTLAKCCAVK